jgi:PAS domain-containing protein
MASVTSSTTGRETESEAAARLQAAFERLRNPMLIVDDERRCVTANAPACGLLGIEPQEVPWRRIDDFTPAEDR